MKKGPKPALFFLLAVVVLTSLIPTTASTSADWLGGDWDYTNSSDRQDISSSGWYCIFGSLKHLFWRRGSNLDHRILQHRFVVIKINLVEEMRILNTRGCHLEVPAEVKNQAEAKGEPLDIGVDIDVTRIRDVPDGGGSFGVELV